MIQISNSPSLLATFHCLAISSETERGKGKTAPIKINGDKRPSETKTRSPSSPTAATIIVMSETAN